MGVKIRQAAKNIASPHQSWLVQKVSAIPMTKTCADGTSVFSETKSTQNPDPFCLVTFQNVYL